MRKKAFVECLGEKKERKKYDFLIVIICEDEKICLPDAFRRRRRGG